MLAFAGGGRTDLEGVAIEVAVDATAAEVTSARHMIVFDDPPRPPFVRR